MQSLIHSRSRLVMFSLSVAFFVFLTSAVASADSSDIIFNDGLESGSTVGWSQTVGDNPGVIWEPESLEAVAVGGEPASYFVTFQAYDDLGLVEPWLTPSLNQYTTVSPSESFEVFGGENHSFEILIDIPSGGAAHQVGGTLHIRSAVGPPRTIPRPLPIQIEVYETVQSAGGDFSLEVPPSVPFVHVEDDGSVVLSLLENPGESQAPTLVVFVLENVAELSLEEFFDGDPWQNLYYPGDPDPFEVLPGMLRFYPSQGFDVSSQTVIPREGSFLVVLDDGSTFENAGILDEILTSLSY